MKLLAIAFLACITAFATSATAAEVWETTPAPAALPAAQATGRVDHDGASIWYATFGAGPPVILLHGGFGNSGNWGDQVPALLAAGYRVVTIDSRGQGRSTRDARPLTYELMESDVIAVMDHLGIGKSDVVGWSDGAIIALVMAIKHPQRERRVFAFAANMDPSGAIPNASSPTITRFLAQAARDYARLSPTPDDYAGLTKAIFTMWETQPNYAAADLAGIRGPAIAIADGDHDEFIKRQHTEYMARTIPGAMLIILPGVSHFAMVQDPAEFNAAMLAFLGGR